MNYVNVLNRDIHVGIELLNWIQFKSPKIECYPEIDNYNFKGALKMRARYEIFIVLLLTSSFKLFP